MPTWPRSGGRGEQGSRYSAGSSPCRCVYGEHPAAVCGGSAAVYGGNASLNHCPFLLSALTLCCQKKKNSGGRRRASALRFFAAMGVKLGGDGLQPLLGCMCAWSARVSEGLSFIYYGFNAAFHGFKPAMNLRCTAFKLGLTAFIEKWDEVRRKKPLRLTRMRGAGAVPSHRDRRGSGKKPTVETRRCPVLMSTVKLGHSVPHGKVSVRCAVLVQGSEACKPPGTDVAY
eukprot:257373-Rhodomonas_salina.1